MEPNFSSDAMTARGASPWTPTERARMLAWETCWRLFCAWTPKPLWRWRNLWLRLFGAKVARRSFVHQRARILIPWHITLHEGACIGDRANLYSLGTITVGPGAIVAQEAYLCAGSHDFTVDALPLTTAPIVVGAEAFIGARAILLPGVSIGNGAIIGAGSVVTRDIAPGVVAAGNPAKVLRERSTRSAGKD